MANGISPWASFDGFKTELKKNPKNKRLPYRKLNNK